MTRTPRVEPLKTREIAGPEHLRLSNVPGEKFGSEETHGGVSAEGAALTGQTTGRIASTRLGAWGRGDLLPVFCLALAILLLFKAAPHDGSFWFSDSPRHALNGVFVSDLVRDHPLSGLKAYAMNYYLRYPALTILFY